MEWIRRHPCIMAWSIVAAVFAVDLCLPLGVASAVPYTFAVLLALSAKPRWMGPLVAGVCCVLTIAKMGISPERGTTELWKVIANRGLAVFALGMMTLIGLLRRKAEERMRQQESELYHLSQRAVAGELAAELAHELNQPLAAVCLQADVANHVAPAEPPELRTALKEITTQSRRAADIVRSIRGSIRPACMEHGSVSLNSVAEAAVRLLAWKTQMVNATVHLHLTANLPPTFGQRIQLEQIVFNLLQNAIEAVAGRADGPRIITVCTSRRNGFVTLVLRDTGGGIADTERIFERFHTTKPDGMGLGLAIARSFATAHGGTLTVANVEGGAEFTLALPADQQVEA